MRGSNSRTGNGRKTTAGNNSAISAEVSSSDHCDDVYDSHHDSHPHVTHGDHGHGFIHRLAGRRAGRPARQGSVSEAAHRAAAESGSDEPDAGRPDGVGARAVLEPRAVAGDQHDAHRPAVGGGIAARRHSGRRGDQHDRPHGGRGGESGAGRRHERPDVGDGEPVGRRGVGNAAHLQLGRRRKSAPRRSARCRRASSRSTSRHATKGLPPAATRTRSTPRTAAAQRSPCRPTRPARSTASARGRTASC